MSRKFVCFTCKYVVSLSRSCVRYFINRTLSSRPHPGSKTSFTGRSHTCGELRGSHVGCSVRLCGWLQYQRLGHFLVLRDWQGSTQVLVPHSKRHEVDGLPLESVLEITGTVQARPDGQQNTRMETGEIEVALDEVKLLNPCLPKLPFSVQEFHKVKESLRMEYRYLDLRNRELQKRLRVRSEMVMKMREFLCNNHGFVDVETPTLFRRTPGGAKEFVVPSRHAGKFYSLPQSPQQFKQLLMVGGVDRYVQIARCYRDEGSKPDRQPEFTQVDIEMSFVGEEDVMALVEQMLVHCWPVDKGRLLQPFPRITYSEAMAKYGVDKPDPRFDMQICDISDVMRHCGVQAFEDILKTDCGSLQAINITRGAKVLSNKEVDQLHILAKEEFSQAISMIKVKEDGSLQSPLVRHLRSDVCERLKAKLSPLSGDLLIIAAGNHFEPHSALGKVRLECADLLESKGVHLRNKDDFQFLWVVDFPLFLPKPEGGVESAHHPFTAPKLEDRHLLQTNPTQVRSQHYDLVLNGAEIGGGSIRIHNAEEQRYVLEEILQEDSSELEHLLTALASGCPPHGGIALGLDRLVASVCGADSIRDVIAFPKSHDGKDPMSKAPAKVEQCDLDPYHIQAKDI